MNGKIKLIATLLPVVIALVAVMQSQAFEGLRAHEESIEHGREASQKDKEQKAKPEQTVREPQDGEQWFGRGYSLHLSGRYREAIAAFKRANDLSYRKATAMYNVACGHAMLNEKEDALAWLEQALGNGFDTTSLLGEDPDLDPLRSDPRFKEITARVNASKDNQQKDRQKPDRFERAVSDYERLRQESSRDGGWWHEVGVKLLRLRELDRAISALTEAVAHLGYRNERAMYDLARAHALKGDKETALNWLEKSVNAGFDESEKLSINADLASLRDDARFSRIENLSRTLSLNQFLGDGSVNSLESKERWRRAIALYESFVKTEPGNGRAWFNLGYGLHYSQESARAIEAFEKSLQLGYRKPTSMYNLACAHAALGRKDEALQWLETSYEAGFKLGDYIRTDKDLDRLRDEPRFKRLLEKVKSKHEDKDKTHTGKY